MSIKPIRIMIIDDHQIIIDGLKSILQDEEDILFAGGANNMQQALEFLSQNPVHVALVDISMPDHSGVDVTKRIHELYPEIKILALTMHEDITMITRMVDAGASGYLLKRSNMKEVVEAIRVVADDKKYLGREVQAILLENLSVKAAPTDADIDADTPGILTSREKEILNLIAIEMNNEQIARKLFISERTVETHRRNILTKTKTKSIVGLIKFAYKHGLISKDDDKV